MEERFESQALPCFARRAQAVGQLIPELCLRGLAVGDFDLALRGLLGEAAPISASAVARLRSSGKPNARSGSRGGWKGWGSSTCGPMECASRPGFGQAAAGLDFGNRLVIAAEDVNGDCHVDRLDLHETPQHSGSDEPLCDMNGDGVVDIQDLAQVSRALED